MNTQVPNLVQNTHVIRHWKVEGLLQSPCWRVRLSNMPNGHTNNVFQTSSGTMHICSYASVMSILDQNFTWANWSRIMSRSGRGVTSRNVLAFCRRVSTMVRRVPFFFSMQRRGIASVPVAGRHHPILLYNSGQLFHEVVQINFPDT
jgi:hypothetical protein